MVIKESAVYLLVGQDSFSKDAKLKRLKEEFLPKDTEAFNLDTLYAKELNLTGLQEKLLCLPVNAKKRLIIIKGAQNLKEDIKEFILKYIRKPRPSVLLVLDVTSGPSEKSGLRRHDSKGQFIQQLSRYSNVFRFQEPAQVDTFALSRQIELRRVDYALRLLHQLLQSGEKPERILGGLRHSWERNMLEPLQIRKRLRLLLNCDINIKTGRLKPDFALERLVINLCCLKKPQN